VDVRSEEVVAFFTDIIYRFGIPNRIIIDNGTQFTGKKFLNFCDNNNIRVDWSVVAHPKVNRQVERATYHSPPGVAAKWSPHCVPLVSRRRRRRHPPLYPFG
jgi:hypothetical protein